jgi:three-Cys-motif partner protein
VRKPPRLKSEQYESDEDGLPREIVGPWVRDKHLRLQHYVGATRAARRKYIGPGKAGATYIDLFCGPGRARIDSGKVIDGSSLVAWRQSVEDRVPFTALHVADAHPQLAAATETRLRRLGAPVHAEIGTANATVDRITAKLRPEGLHFALLDPYGLSALPFEVIRKLASFKRMDLLVHVSVQGLQRNLGRFIRSKSCSLDAFAPGWRERVDASRPELMIRTRVFEHWAQLLKGVGLTVAGAVELVTAGSNQPLYWLAFAARHPLPIELWEKISNIGLQGRLRLGPSSPAK